MKLHSSMFNSLSIAFSLALMCLIGTGSLRPAYAEGTLISAPSRVDMAHDLNRNILYITSGGDVLRYDLKAQQFLPPFQLSGNLKGLDLSPDSNTLAVADNTYTDGQNWIFLIDLQTGNSQRVTFPLTNGEGGTFSVAFGNDGNILVTSTYNGSGWVPLRKYNPLSGTITILKPAISQNTMLSASADGSIIGFAESNISDGRWGRYRVNDGDLVERTGYTDGTSWYNYEIGTNRDGTQFAIPTYGGTFVYDANFGKVTTIGQYAGPQPVGVVYHPIDNLVYFAWAETTEVRAYDTTTFAQVGSYNFEYTFQHTGNWAFTQGRLKVARDGSLLFATVDGGVRYVNLKGDPPVAHDLSLQTDEDTPVPVTLQAEAPNGSTLTFQILTLPQHGTLSGEAPNLIYAPAANYSGPDSFSFNAKNGGLESNTATVTINVLPVNDPPIARDDTAYAQFGKSVVIPVLANDEDVDGDKLTITSVSRPLYGSVTILSNGTLRYIPWRAPPPRSKSLVDVFRYAISDGHGATAYAKVTVNIVR